MEISGEQSEQARNWCACACPRGGGYSVCVCGGGEDWGLYRNK
jgi:hypothetical protein